MKVRWTPLGKSSLLETTQFILEVWDDHVAEKFLSQLDDRIDQIKKSPELAPAFLNSNYRQLQIHETTSLFYSVHSNHIKLLLVWDNRQNPSDLLKKLQSP